MFIIRVLILFVLGSCSAYAEIRQTHDLQSIKREIFASSKDTLFVFDIDFVLVTPTDDVFLLTITEEGQQLQSNIYDDLWKRLPKHSVDELHTILMTTQEWRPVTPNTAQVFNQIRAKGYKVLGLTALITGSVGVIPSMESWRAEQLERLGIVFDKSFVNAKSGSLDPYITGISDYYSKSQRASFPTAYNGIIFTTFIPKGEALNAYLQFAKLKPKKIIFIDDRLANLESVQEYCQKYGIEYIGFEYTAIKVQAKDLKLNKRRSVLQYKILELTKTWLNDAQADAILMEIEK